MDAGLVALAYYLAYRLRFDGGVPSDYQQLFEHTLSFVVIGSVTIFAGFGLYRHWMRYSSQREYLRIVQAVVTAVLALVAYVAVVKPKEIFVGYPRGFVSVSIPTGVLVLYGLLALVFLGAVRYAVHLYFERPVGGYRARRGARSVLIVGAGDGGRLLLREILRNPDLGMRPVGFVDDDPRKQGVRVDRGLDVLGTTEELGYVLDDVEPDEVLIAIPSAPGTLRARVVKACRERGVRVKTMPTVFELLQTGGGRYIKQVREVRVEDVLGREPVRMDVEAAGGYLTGRCVMVTGAGGSIGAELSRQIARVGPSRLVLIDHAEDNLFEITRELVEDRHALNTVAVLADCKEEERMREVFREHRPTVVFHAAAYKHVGLMEDNPVEAVRNNAIATRVMTRVAGDTGTKVFVQVSTDKAVDPATVMGASKALAEWAAEAANARYEDTAYTSVRFGNVLNSSGSVVPIFRRQIEAGGPVTVTDPDMTRFFMTIPEAVQLVIRAGSLAPGRRGVRARDGRARPDHRPGRGHDPLLGPGAGARHRDRDRRPAARREAARGPVQRLRAPRADTGAEDPAGAPARRRPRVGRGDLRPHRAARARGRRGGPGGHRLRARDGPRGRPGARAGADRGGRDPARRGRRAAGQPHGLLDSLTPSMVHLLAFSLQDQVEKYGAYIGIAAFFGLAVLSILYFAQARELRRLRDWAGRAPERAQEVEARAVAQAEAARRVQSLPQRTPPPKPATTAARRRDRRLRGRCRARHGRAGDPGRRARRGRRPGRQRHRGGRLGGRRGESPPAARPPGRTARSPPAAARRPPARVPLRPPPPRRPGRRTGRPQEGDAKPEAEQPAEAEAKPADGESATPGEAEAKPEEAKEPAGAEPEAAKPEAGEPDAAKPEAGEPDAAKPEAGEPDAAKPDAGPAGAPGAAAPAADSPTPQRRPAATRSRPTPKPDERRRLGRDPGRARPARDAAPAPQPGARRPLRQPSRSATVPPRRPAPSGARRSPVTPASSTRGGSKLVPALIGAGALVLVVVALFVTGVLGGGGSDDALVVHAGHDEQRHARRHRVVAVHAHARGDQGGRAQRHHDPRPGLAGEGHAHRGGLQRDRDGQQHRSAARRAPP